jgi:hypothetical protein
MNAKMKTGIIEATHLKPTYARSLLERRNNPGNGQDKTYQYRLEEKRLNELLGLSFSNGKIFVVKAEKPRDYGF